MRNANIMSRHPIHRTSSTYGLFSVVAALLLVPAISPASAQVIPDHYIVVLNDDVANPAAAAQALAARQGVRLGHVYEHALKGFSFSGPAAAARAIARNPAVAYVEADLEAHAILHANDFQTLTTGVDRMDAELNSTANIDGADDRVDVDVAIIDTGIDIDHPDLPPVVGGRHYYTISGGRPSLRGSFEDDNYDDDNGHGTHVSGTVAALDNGIGVVGIAPGARLWAVKVLNSNGSGTFADVIKGIDFVTANAAEIEVANMSLGGQGKLNSLRTAIQNSVNAGVVYVVAAGNDSKDVYGNDGVFDTNDDFVPATYPEVAAISAMGDTDGQWGGDGPNTSYATADDTFADFTNFSRSVVAENPVTSSGAAIDLAGPGVDITSTWLDGTYATISGTSMASPHVAGAAALEAATNGRASDAAGVAQIRQALIDASEAQIDWGPANTGDPDANPEGLVKVAASGTPNDRPVVAITSPASSTFDSGATILFEGTANDTEDGDLSGSLVWTSDLDGPIGSGGSFSTVLGDGNHTITASATDSGLKTGSASVSITVGDPPAAAASVSVSSVNYATEGGKSGDKHLLVTVELVDDLAAPVANASLFIDLFRDGNVIATGAGTTGAGGSVTFTLKNARAGCYSTDVTGVTAAGLAWDGTTPSNGFCK